MKEGDVKGTPFNVLMYLSDFVDEEDLSEDLPLKDILKEVEIPFIEN